jgi:uncharacterized membrane protein YheB (UPF0754 family)
MDSLAAEVGNYAEDYIREHGPQLISDQLEKEISGLEEKRIYQLGERLLGHEEVLEEKIREIYRVSIGKAASALVAQFHISQIIEDKIKAMKVEELEALVMSVKTRVGHDRQSRRPDWICAGSGKCIYLMEPH